MEWKGRVARSALLPVIQRAIMTGNIQQVTYIRGVLSAFQRPGLRSEPLRALTPAKSMIPLPIRPLAITFHSRYCATIQSVWQSFFARN